MFVLVFTEYLLPSPAFLTMTEQLIEYRRGREDLLKEEVIFYCHAFFLLHLPASATKACMLRFRVMDLFMK